MSFRTKTQVPNAQRRAGRGDAAAAPHVRLRPLDAGRRGPAVSVRGGLQGRAG